MSTKLEERKSSVRNIRQTSKLPSGEEQFGVFGGSVVAEKLSPQLGTDSKALTEGAFDMRRLSIINDQLLAALAYFSWRGKKVKFWRHIVDEYLNLAPSVRGVGRRQLIEMQRATTPGAPPAPVPERPGWLGRNVTKRDWEERTGYE